MNESIITTLEKQKNKRRYNVFINDEFAFSVHEDILIKYRLARGKVIDPTEWEEILKAEEKNRIHQYAISYLGLRARTSEELLDYLVGKGFTKDDCLEEVESCKRHGYVNDEAYAGAWIESRKRSRPRGKHLLRLELLNKGIESSTVEAKLLEVLSPNDEEDMIKSLIEKKLRNTSFETSFELKKKLVPYLQRKGFSLEQIMAVIDRIINTYLNT
jgi:regulatory protein